MKTIKLFLLGIGLTVLLTGCAGASEDFQNKTDSGNLSAVNGTTYDWGNINIKGGVASRIFDFKNDSPDPLYLKGAETSCMCTQARYRLSDSSISPKYGMHNNPTGWATKVQPGETFEVEVLFDPMAHGPNATGPIQRDIMLFTSEKNNPVMKLKVSGNVLSEQEYLDQQPL